MTEEGLTRYWNNRKSIKQRGVVFIEYSKQSGMYVLASRGAAGLLERAFTYSFFTALAILLLMSTAGCCSFMFCIKWLEASESVKRDGHGEMELASKAMEEIQEEADYSEQPEDLPKY